MRWERGNLPLSTGISLGRRGTVQVPPVIDAPRGAWLAFAMEDYGPSTYGDRSADAYDEWISTRARDTEGAVRFLAELAGTEPGLLGYWKLSEGQGTTAHDSSPNKNDGTISGASWTPDGAPVTP